MLTVVGVQLEYIKRDGSRATSPKRFNQASFQLDVAGTPANPEIDCHHRIRDSACDLHAGRLRPAGPAATGTQR